MNRMDFAVVDANLRHMMRFFSRASETGEVREMAGVSIISSGIDYGVMNSAMLTSPVTGGQVELDRRIAIPEVHFQMRGLRWSFWVCEDMIESPSPRRAKEYFRTKGFRLLSDPPGMIAERLRPPVRPLPPIEVRRVRDQATRLDFAELVSICFELPLAISKNTYSRQESWHREIEGYIAYVAGCPVCTAAIAVTPDAIGLYSVGTAPDYQRQGYAEALVRHVIAKTAAATGIERTVLQSSQSAYSLYERMGFRTVTRFWILLPY